MNHEPVRSIIDFSTCCSPKYRTPRLPLIFRQNFPPTPCDNSPNFPDELFAKNAILRAKLNLLVPSPALWSFLNSVFLPSGNCISVRGAKAIKYQASQTDAPAASQFVWIQTNGGKRYAEANFINRKARLKMGKTATQLGSSPPLYPSPFLPSSRSLSRETNAN